MYHCNSLTKNNQPCKVRVSVNSQLYNGMRLCHVHLKSYINNAVIPIQSLNNNQIIEYIPAENILKNIVRCSSKTKKGCRCSKKTSDDSRLCHIHQKQLVNTNRKSEKEPENTEKEIEYVSKSILSIIKSPCINYKTDKKSDNCYICLEETECKLSCGHFIHMKCMLNTLQSNIKKNYRVFEHKNNYFIITNCLYCKQISIMKKVPITEQLKRKYDVRKNSRSCSLDSEVFGGKMKINNETISYYFGELYLKYDNYETKEQLEKIEEEFMEEMKQIVFDNFATIVFDNYIQQKNITKIPLKYERIEKKIIMNNINNVIENTLYSRYLFDKVKNKMELFFRILENVVCKMIDLDNVQDDILSLVNVF